MKKHIALIASILFVLALTGCGSKIEVPEDVTVTSIAIDGDGAITEYLVDSFDKDYYDVTELKNMAVNFADEYNQENKSGDSEQVSVIDSKLNSKNDVVLSTKYLNGKAYAGFTGEDFFYGTIEEAKAGGYSLNFNFMKADDGSKVTLEDATEDADVHILITSVKAVVYGNSTPEYISDGCIYDKDAKTVSTMDSTKNVAIIFSK